MTSRERITQAEKRKIVRLYLEKLPRHREEQRSEKMAQSKARNEVCRITGYSLTTVKKYLQGIPA